MPPNSPIQQLTNLVIWWNKKRRGSLFLRAYPCSQAFALPPSKDKQRKPAHAKWNYTLHVRACPNNIKVHASSYNSLTRTLRCITSVLGFKVAKFDCTDSNVRKRLFPLTVLTNGVLSLQIPSKFVLTRPALTAISHCWPQAAWTGLVAAKLHIFSQFTLTICKKTRK